MKKIMFMFLLTILFTSGAFAQTADLPFLQEPKQSVFTGGQPTLEGFRLLSERGVKTIINLRQSSEETAYDESVMASQLNMSYYNIPMKPGTITAKYVKEFASIYKKNLSRPMFIHCAEGNRVAGLWLAYRTMLENIPLGVALREARKIGIKSEYEDIVIQFVLSEKHRIEPPKELPSPEITR